MASQAGGRARGAVAVVAPAPPSSGAGRVTSDGRVLLELAYPAAGHPLSVVRDLDTGAGRSVGLARAVSPDGRVVFDPDGSRRPVDGGVVFTPDVSGWLMPGEGFSANFASSVMSDDGMRYTFTLVRHLAGSNVEVYVDVVRGTVVASAVTGISPGGRYRVEADRLVDTSTETTLVVAPSGSSLVAVADDAASVRCDAVSCHRVLLDGTVSWPVPHGAEAGLPTGGRFELSGDLRVGLYQSNFPDTNDAVVVDFVTGVRFRLERDPRPVARDLTMDNGWRLSGDGDTAVHVFLRCDLSHTACSYGTPQVVRGLRARLAAFPVYELTRLAAGGQGAVHVTGLPPGSGAAILNVTATDSAGPGFVTVWPCGEPWPLASNLNHGTGGTVANAVAATLDANGAACFYSHGGTDLVVDRLGTFGPAYVAMTPTRVLDTRTSGRPSHADTVVLDLTDDGLSGPVVLNVTATEAAADAFVTVYPCTTDRPLASNLNVAAGGTVANLVVTDASGPICLYRNQPAHLVVDVSGRFEASSYRPAIASRLVDTRTNETGRASLPAANTLRVPIPSPAGGGAAPAGTTVVLNITAINGTTDGYVTIWPCGQPRPLASNLNHSTARPVANVAFAVTGDHGDVCVYNQTPVDLIVDLQGSIDPTSTQPTPFTAETPHRLIDTRHN